MKVRDLMSYPLNTVRPDATVLDAITAMVDGKKGGIIVCGEGLLKECQGIVTTTKIFEKVLAIGVSPNGIKISDVMTPAPLITIGPNATVKEAADLMIKYNIRRLPVVEDHTLVGIITSKDLLKCVK
ncbi:MAG: CBS domain-containing protein [Methanotrichaceae archaeon]|jgi:CBS domain-containing protein